MLYKTQIKWSNHAAHLGLAFDMRLSEYLPNTDSTISSLQVGCKCCFKYPVGFMEPARHQALPRLPCLDSLWGLWETVKPSEACEGLVKGGRTFWRKTGKKEAWQIEEKLGNKLLTDNLRSKLNAYLVGQSKCFAGLKLGSNLCLIHIWHLKLLGFFFPSA